MTGFVLDIQRFSVHDGPGIRTTVFLQGCTLRCRWCHNPESIPRRPVLRYFESRCVYCGACEAACPHGAHQVRGRSHTINRDKCRSCGACVAACPTGALMLSSSEMNAGEVIRVVKEDLPFYAQSGGGMTLSGGEPLVQVDFAVDLLQKAREAGIHTTLDTAGHVPFESLQRALPYTQLFLYDYKVTKDGKTQIGADGTLILRNLKALHDAGASIILRCPIIPGINDNEEHLNGIAGVLRECPDIKAVQLLAYHRLGTGKYKEIGQDYSLADTAPMTREEKDAFFAQARRVIRPDIIWG
ncbi:MAG: glycyl-radical enzyme activating protein [Christensenellales bacterium]|jgi:pyruvate formate lyase activating enzyme